MQEQHFVSQFWLDVAAGVRDLPQAPAPGRFLEAVAETGNVPAAMKITHTDKIAVLAWSADPAFAAELSDLVPV
jgi:hypothetical protein